MGKGLDLSKTEKRFGGNSTIGTVITYGWPGQGFASYPWALDHYERDLGLKPKETWLLKRMIRHAWNFRDPVYISLRKVTRDAIISSKTLHKLKDELLLKGFIALVGLGEGFDRRKRYDISGTYSALYFSIATDPKSEFVKVEYDGEPKKLISKMPAEIQNHVFDFEYTNGRATVKDINNISNRFGHILDWRILRLYPRSEDVHLERKLTTEEVTSRIFGFASDDFLDD